MTENNLKHIGVAELVGSLSDTLAQVFYRGITVVIERHGKPMAVLVDPETFARFQCWQAEQGSIQQSPAAPKTAKTAGG